MPDDRTVDGEVRRPWAPVDAIGVELGDVDGQRDGRELSGERDYVKLGDR